MELNIAIVDDQEADGERLRRDILSWRGLGPGRAGTVLRYPSGESMLEGFTPGTVQLVFMDIYMGALNGVETARRLRATDGKLLIVFLTTSGDFAFDVFPVHPFEYILKPYEPHKVYGVLDDAVRALAPEDPSIAIRLLPGQGSAANGICNVPLRNISAVSSQRHNMEFSMADGQCLTSRMNFGEIEALLAGDPRFLSCNRGLLVNMDQVASLEGDAFRMKNGSTCPIRVRGRLKTVADFSQYRLRKMREN